MTWKIGLNSQARKLSGSALGVAGVSGGCGVGVGAGLPDAPGAAVAQAATTTARSASSRSCPHGRRRRRDGITSGTPR